MRVFADVAHVVRFLKAQEEFDEAHPSPRILAQRASEGFRLYADALARRHARAHEEGPRAPHVRASAISHEYGMLPKDHGIVATFDAQRANARRLLAILHVAPQRMFLSMEVGGNDVPGAHADARRSFEHHSARPIGSETDATQMPGQDQHFAVSHGDAAHVLNGGATHGTRRSVIQRPFAQATLAKNVAAARHLVHRLARDEAHGTITFRLYHAATSFLGAKDFFW